MTATAKSPLEGMLVLDLGQIYQGPYCGLLLGFMGARVLKIESPEGDIVRRRKRNVEPYPLVCSTPTRSRWSSTSSIPRARRCSCGSCAKADVVVENFAAGVMDRLGLGWEVLRAENPRLVYGSGKGFGLSGPYRDLPAMDLTIQAMSGIMNATGYPGPAAGQGRARRVRLPRRRPPLRRHHERAAPPRAHGQGQLVEVSMLEAAVVALASALGVFMDGDGGVPERTGNRHPALAIAPYNVYPTRDGFVAIFTASERHWHSITRVLGREDLLTTRTTRARRRAPRTWRRSTPW